MARAMRSWLSGPEPIESGTSNGGASEYPGQRLGLPQSGPGSVARFGRRVGAMTLDWFIANGVTALAVPLGLMSRDQFLFSGDSRTVALVVWLVVGLLSLRLFGFTPGQFALGLKVISADRRDQVGIGRAAARGLLITLVIPPLFTDADLRGLQDLATKTAVVLR
ncbi:MAG: RDD family protein [Mycobacterium sp.]